MPTEDILLAHGEIAAWCDTRTTYTFGGWWFETDNTGRCVDPTWVAPGNIVYHGPLGNEEVIFVPFAVGDVVRFPPYRFKDVLNPHPHLFNRVGRIEASPRLYTVRVGGESHHHIWNEELAFVGRPIDPRSTK
jgi:hypothetical protein